jgi:hypothetical protein
MPNERSGRRVAMLVPLLALAACGTHTIHFDFASVDSPRVCSGYPGTSDGVAWAVGSAVRVNLFAAGGPGACTLGPKLPLPNCGDFTAPQNLAFTETAPDVWKVEPSSDPTSIVLRAIAPGEGGVRVTADNAGGAELNLRAVAPSSAVLSWVADDWVVSKQWLTKPALATGSTLSLIPSVVDAAGAALCVPGRDSEIAAEGLTILSLPSEVGIDREVTVAVPASPGQASLDVSFGGSGATAWSATVPLSLLESSAITSFSTEQTELTSTFVSVRLRAWAGDSEVYGAQFLIEDLTPTVVDLVDATGASVSQRTTRQLVETLMRTGARSGQGPLGQGQAQLRVSVPGAALEPQTLTFTFPN